MQYIPGDLLEEARLAIKAHVPVGTVSRRLGISVEELKERLEIPLFTDKPIRGDVESGVNLWRCDDLDCVL